MGCNISTAAVSESTSKKRSSTEETDELVNEVSYSSVKKRYGKPSYYKIDGFDFGLRTKVKAQSQTFYIGTGRATGSKVTIKEFHMAHCTEDDVTREMMILAKLTTSHDCGVPNLREVFVTDTSLFAVTDYVDSMRLMHYIDLKRKTTSLTAADARQITSTLLSIAAYCHSQGVTIRSIAPSNIALRRGGQQAGWEVTVADMSLAVSSGSADVLLSHPLFDREEVLFSSPEALRGRAYDCTTDVWSIGMVLCVMAAGALPFAPADGEELLVERLQTDDQAFRFDFAGSPWAAIDPQVMSAVQTLLVVDATQRPQATHALKHGWLLAEE